MLSFRRSTPWLNLTGRHMERWTQGGEKELSEIAQRLAQADANVDELSRKLEQLRVNPSASEDAKRLEESLRAAEKGWRSYKLPPASTKSQISDLSAQTTGGFAKAVTRLKSFAKQLGSGVTGAAKKAGQAAGWLKEKNNCSWPGKRI